MVEKITSPVSPNGVLSKINDIIDAIPTSTTQLTNDSGYITGITASMVTDALTYTPENANNLTTTLSASSTDSQYPSAKAVYDLIDINTSAIASNTSAIATNTSAIAVNTTNIASNTSAIAVNTTNIASNTSAIAVNTTNIASNTSAIATNTSAITVNTTNIATNTSAIAVNTTNIASNTSAISTINGKIPSAASSENQLADKNFVNSSIATNTAYFIGTFDSLAELEAYSGTLTNNDYAFVATTDVAGNTLYDRYKYSTGTNPASWIFEYELNNSSFTSDQWAAINSGITTNSKVTRSATTAVGGTTRPVYVDDTGIVTTIGYTIETSVPSGALFTDTTYSVMTGATSVAAGATGLVPAPGIGDNEKFLRGDGTWAESSGGVSYAMVVTDYTEDV